MPAMATVTAVFLASAPRRSIVRSSKVNSDHDASPVRTPVPSGTESLTAASRAAAADAEQIDVAKDGGSGKVVGQLGHGPRLTIVLAAVDPIPRHCVSARSSGPWLGSSCQFRAARCV